MLIFALQVSGTIAEAVAKVEAEVTDPNGKAALLAILAAAPGQRVSLAATMSSMDGGTYGSLSINGSFWTPK